MAASFALLLALCAATAGTLLAVLPAALVSTLAGLALLGVVIEALRKATATDLPLGRSSPWRSPPRT